MSTILVRLFEMNGCGLIVPHPSGIEYQNQCNGRTCSQGVLEGIFVPVDWHEAAGAMEEVFWGGDLTPEDADRIDSKLAGRGARVDRAKLDRSCEAWVWVTLEKGHRLIHGLTPREAVFVWPNSD